MVLVVCSQIFAQLERRPLQVIDLDVSKHSIDVVAILLHKSLHNYEIIAAQLGNSRLDILGLRNGIVEHFLQPIKSSTGLLLIIVVLNDLNLTFLAISDIDVFSLLRLQVCLSLASYFVERSAAVDYVGHVQVLTHLQTELLEILLKRLGLDPVLSGFLR